MTKITTSTITTGYQSTSELNTNFSNLAYELNNKVLYRNNPAGEPNVMMQDLDMNSYQTINLGTPTLASHAITKGYADVHYGSVAINTAETAAAAAAASAAAAAVSETSAATSALACQALANMTWASFTITDGELIVSYVNGTTSLPSLVDGELIITF